MKEIDTIDPEDVRRLKAALKSLGYHVSDWAIQYAYREWSEEYYAAGWLVLPEDEDVLLYRAKGIVSFLPPNTAKSAADIACAGLELPDNVNPGALTNVIKAAKKLRQFEEKYQTQKFSSPREVIEPYLHLDELRKDLYLALGTLEGEVE